MNTCSRLCICPSRLCSLTGGIIPVNISLRLSFCIWTRIDLLLRVRVTGLRRNLAILGISAWFRYSFTILSRGNITTTARLHILLYTCIYPRRSACSITLGCPAFYILLRRAIDSSGISITPISLSYIARNIAIGITVPSIN